MCLSHIHHRSSADGAAMQWNNSWKRNSPPGLLKWPNSPYRPAVPGKTARASRRAPRTGLLGRSQAVRQRILIPPFGGSILPAPAN